MDIAKDIAADIIGRSGIEATIGGNTYILRPPTIERLCGAYLYLSEFTDLNLSEDVFSILPKLEDACKALSWFIQGNEFIAEQLKQGTPAEVIDALVTALSMVNIENFVKLSVSARSVQKLIAVTR